jgi:hypothetical protein
MITRKQRYLHLQKFPQPDGAWRTASQRAGLHVHAGRPQLPGPGAGVAATHLLQQEIELLQPSTTTTTACETLSGCKAQLPECVPRHTCKLLALKEQQVLSISCAAHGQQQQDWCQCAGAGVSEVEQVLHLRGWVSHESCLEGVQSGCLTRGGPCQPGTGERTQHSALVASHHMQQQHGSSTELMGLIKGSRSWQDLAAAFSAGTQLSIPGAATVVHASAALTHLAQLATGRVAGSTASQHSREQAQLGVHLNSTDSNGSRASARTCAELAGWLVSWVLAERHQLRARQVANLAWAVCRLQGAGILAQEVGSPLLATLVQRADVQWAHFKPQELSSLALAVATADAAVTDDWVGHLARAALRGLPDMSAQGHANLLWALAQWHKRRGSNGGVMAGGSGSAQQGPCLSLSQQAVISRLLRGIWDVTAPQLPMWPAGSLAVAAWAATVLQVCRAGANSGKRACNGMQIAAGEPHGPVYVAAW